MKKSTRKKPRKILRKRNKTVQPLVHCRRCGRLGKNVADCLCQACVNEMVAKGRRRVIVGTNLHESRTPLSIMGLSKAPPLLLQTPQMIEASRSISVEYSLGIGFYPGMFVDDTYQRHTLDQNGSIIALMARLKESHLPDFQSIFFKTDMWTPERIFDWLNGIGYEVGAMMESVEIGLLKPVINPKAKGNRDLIIREFYSEAEQILAFYCDPVAFEPDHFQSFWIDQSKGVQAIIAKPINSNNLKIQRIFFARKFLWDKDSIQQYFTAHPRYISDAYSPKALSPSLSQRHVTRPTLMLEGWHRWKTFKPKGGEST